MKSRGKLVGVLVGLLLGFGLRRPWLAVLGLLLGHLYDTGAFGKPHPPASSAPPAADPYQVLGVSREASDEEIEQAWRRRMQEYHPDRVANAASELRELAGRRAREANEAWEAIRRQRRP